MIARLDQLAENNGGHVSSDTPGIITNFPQFVDQETLQTLIPLVVSKI